MKSDVVRTYKTVHTWSGIAAGLLLFIAFYAGAISVFEPALARWATPPASRVTPLEQAEALMARAIAEHPQSKRQFTLHLGEAGDIPARMTWRLSREDPAQFGAELDETGGVSVTTLTDRGLGQFIDDLHRSGGLSTDAHLGATLMGIVSAVYALALFSGVVIVLPSLVRDLFALRIGANLKRMWMDAHNLAGIVSLPFHMVIAVTAVVFGLHDEIYDGLNYVVHRGEQQKIIQLEAPNATIPRNPAPAAMLAPAELLARLENVAPGFRPYAIEYRDAGTQGAGAMVWGRDESRLMRGRGYALMSAVTGEVVNTYYLPGHQSGYGPMVSAFFALHFASFGGAPVKWGYVVLGLAGAFLFYSGNLLWVESRRRRDAAAGGAAGQRRVARWMAAGTVGVCLGCVIGVSVAVVASKWLHGQVADIGAWRWGLYYAALLAGVGWAFARGAGRAGAELLWAAAAVTAAIPLTSLAAWVWPGAGLWVWREALGVDAAACVAAAVLAVLARASARRARCGAENSVWSPGVRACA